MQAMQAVRQPKIVRGYINQRVLCQSQGVCQPEVVRQSKGNATAYISIYPRSPAPPSLLPTFILTLIYFHPNMYTSTCHCVYTHAYTFERFAYDFERVLSLMLVCDAQLSVVYEVTYQIQLVINFLPRNFPNSILTWSDEDSVFAFAQFILFVYDQRACVDVRFICGKSTMQTKQTHINLHCNTENQGIDLQLLRRYHYERIRGILFFYHEKI